MISKYREKEMARETPPERIGNIFQRLTDLVRDEFGNNLKLLPPHVIDLHKDGYIGMYAYPFYSHVCFRIVLL